MSTDEATPTPETEEVVRGGQRIIVVNSRATHEGDELPPRPQRSLGAVAAHATDPASADHRPRRRGRGGALVGIVVTAVPFAAAAYGITLLEGRSQVLGLTAALVALWVVGLVLAWRGLGPRGRDGRSGVWFGRAFGLVIGFVAGVYLLLDTVRPLL